MVGHTRTAITWTQSVHASGSTRNPNSYLWCANFWELLRRSVGYGRRVCISTACHVFNGTDGVGPLSHRPGNFHLALPGNYFSEFEALALCHGLGSATFQITNHQSFCAGQLSFSTRDEIAKSKCARRVSDSR